MGPIGTFHAPPYRIGFTVPFQECMESIPLVREAVLWYAEEEMHRYKFECNTYDGHERKEEMSEEELLSLVSNYGVPMTYHSHHSVSDSDSDRFRAVPWQEYAEVEGLVKDSSWVEVVLPCYTGESGRMLQGEVFFTVVQLLPPKGMELIEESSMDTSVAEYADRGLLDFKEMLERETRLHSYLTGHGLRPEKTGLVSAMLTRSWG
ncbi:hypothetical protein KIPB_004258 [Kipferlia bialata]|uniref:Uncharacterized protein n=1 Tax=Kipferlia bialata TaxID=797122 RepID=A0A9K3CV58_9EUKA|nr:hypothetical protein KIPB_004258 [Kipferlia bialata]|eukprot:g4258.t1